MGLALLGGMLAAFGQAPVGLWPVMLLGLGLFIRQMALAENRPAALWLGWAGGFGHFALAMSWIVAPFLVEPETYGWMAPFALILMAGGLALFWALAAWLAHVAGQGRASRAALFALALVLAEALRGWIFTGLPWAMPGHAFIGSAFDQLAALGGALLLTLLATTVAACPVIWPRTGLFPALALLTAAFTFGQSRLAEPLPPDHGARLRLVQPGIDQAAKWDPVQAEANFASLIRLSRQGDSAPDLVIWPETSIPYLFDASIAQAIARGTGGLQVATGAQIIEGDAAYNSLVVLDGQGALAARYDKAHLVPFGEYIPFGDLAYRWFGLRAFAAQQGYGYAKGPGPALLDLGPLGQVLPLICYEAVFARDLHAAPEGADWLLQITNDAWFGTWQGPFQHFDLARLRAIEQGKPMVRVGNTGITALIDARGRVLALLPLGEIGTLDVNLPGRLELTLYAQYGDWPIIVLIATLFELIAAMARRKPH
jgi:apolipoprotein N-acyltransferase